MVLLHLIRPCVSFPAHAPCCESPPLLLRCAVIGCHGHMQPAELCSGCFRGEDKAERK
jgi:hypothetical protein